MKSVNCEQGVVEIQRYFVAVENYLLDLLVQIFISLAQVLQTRFPPYPTVPHVDCEVVGVELEVFLQALMLDSIVVMECWTLVDVMGSIVIIT